MLARQIGIVLCRVGAAVLVVQAIRSLGYTLPGMFFNDNFNTEILGFSLLSLVPGLAAVGLWVFAGQISDVADASNRDRADESLQSVDIVRVGTALIGVYLVVAGITSAASVEVMNALRPDLDGEFQRVIDEQTARVAGLRASYIVEMVLGLALVLGRNRLSASISKVRTAGIDTYQDRS